MDLSHFKTNGVFLMLALDHRDSLRKLINPSDPSVVTDEQIIEIKSEIISALQDQFSGVLLDPKWGLPAYKNKTKPYLLCIEKTGYVDRDGDRITELEYTVEALQQQGASGIKLLIHYDHDSSTSNTQMETAKKVMHECHAHNLPFFLEIVTYNERGEKGKQIMNAVNMFLDQGIRADVFKLEYPGEEQYCDLITRTLGETPWILLTRGADFDTFESQLMIASAHGASGFLAGRALWQDGLSLSPAQRKEFVSSVVTSRFQKICQAAKG